LQSALRAAAARRQIAAAVTPSAILFIEAEFSATITASGGTLALTVPSGTLVASDTYYLAFFDPNTLSLGWQLDWAGPASVSGNGLTFALPAVDFLGLTTYGFAVYGISASGAQPTPIPTVAPSTSPSASPTPTPSTSPSGSPTASPTPTATPTPTPTPTATATATVAPNVLQANPTNVEIPAPGVADAQTVVVTESGYNGTLSQTNSCGGGTPIASFSAANASGPTWNLVVTGLSAGTCVATVSDTNAQTVTLSISVTSSGFTINSLQRKGP
jgi:hypothetical protein